MKKQPLKPVRAWTWSIMNTNKDIRELCYFTFSTKKLLLQDHKPSPEAIPECVMLVPLNQYRKQKQLSRRKKLNNYE